MICYIRISAMGEKRAGKVRTCDSPSHGQEDFTDQFLYHYRPDRSERIAIWISSGTAL